jgi:hypothetical protein
MNIALKEGIETQPEELLALLHLAGGSKENLRSGTWLASHVFAGSDTQVPFSNASGLSPNGLS